MGAFSLLRFRRIRIGEHGAQAMTSIHRRASFEESIGYSFRFGRIGVYREPRWVAPLSHLCIIVVVVHFRVGVRAG